MTLVSPVYPPCFRPVLLTVLGTSSPDRIPGCLVWGLVSSVCGTTLGSYSGVGNGVQAPEVVLGELREKNLLVGVPMVLGIFGIRGTEPGVGEYWTK